MDSCFDELPSTNISLQLAVYYYALKVYSALQPFNADHVYALYRQTPAKIIARVLDFVNHSSDNKWPEEVDALVVKMKNYQGMLEDYNQACTLQRLGKGRNTFDDILQTYLAHYNTCNIINRLIINVYSHFPCCMG